MKLDSKARSVDLDPREPQFCQNPYAAYRRIHEVVPVFKWEQYGHWCFAKHEHVSALLRDRRFGRQILHLASREELGWAEVASHLKPFWNSNHPSTPGFGAW
jgi:cytochrome P450